MSEAVQTAMDFVSCDERSTSRFIHSQSHFSLQCAVRLLGRKCRSTLMFVVTDPRYPETQAERDDSN